MDNQDSWQVSFDDVEVLETTNDYPYTQIRGYEPGEEPENAQEWLSFDESATTMPSYGRTNDRTTMSAASNLEQLAPSPYPGQSPYPETLITHGTNEIQRPSYNQEEANETSTVPDGSFNSLTQYPVSQEFNTSKDEVESTDIASIFAGYGELAPEMTLGAPAIRQLSTSGLNMHHKEGIAGSFPNSSCRKRKASQELENPLKSQKQRTTSPEIEPLSGRVINSAETPAKLFIEPCPYRNVAEALAALRRQQWHGIPTAFTDDDLNSMADRFYRASADCSGFLDKVKNPGAQRPSVKTGIRLVDGDIDYRKLWEACFNLADAVRRLHNENEGTWLDGRIDPTTLRGNRPERDWTAAEREDLICEALRKCKKLVEDAVDQPENLEHLLVLAPRHALKSRLGNMKLNDNKARNLKNKGLLDDGDDQDAARSTSRRPQQNKDSETSGRKSTARAKPRSNPRSTRRVTARVERSTNHNEYSYLRRMEQRLGQPLQPLQPLQTGAEILDVGASELPSLPVSVPDLDPFEHDSRTNSNIDPVLLDANYPDWFNDNADTRDLSPSMQNILSEAPAQDTFAALNPTIYPEVNQSESMYPLLSSGTDMLGTSATGALMHETSTVHNTSPPIPTDRNTASMNQERQQRNHRAYHDLYFNDVNSILEGGIEDKSKGYDIGNEFLSD
ncbi:uncharacterized protein PV09_02110 [Verruconis gallopava]|uniref:Uncharacterized protein n=1 Tax=Verruconis gallopava TaxID=253628 RepID=A0A0D2AL47_9PEZI|nr:uncharacterized protein PV09_02110 [Verruconis gallopava]KIW07255.1 hypothetical protein PV09_02110 [Verruconis gallopava]